MSTYTRVSLGVLVKLTLVLAIIATCLQIPMLIAMFFVQNIALDENEQVVYGGKRIAMDKKRQTTDKEEESIEEK